ncbi:DNA replication/repair protein RecF [Halalkalibacter nanhaiisediminis]|uniref:DNA replication and repair protein RecF n=1 Tax=Halalkalibacter nanhaiisediminis TaxID=688079 RepID=A0A562QTN2_9BACI|nr:DNA replication/repair protein RecF [Halalkalibacter nanhaiisediminis]TWI59590.1 DNA replication and repair protein RecF [Halalkalibacter nanhaiisediminis]
MYLKQLNVRQFRNYKTAELSFDHYVNVFLGENAQGKTNVLEAIYVLALAKSHRTSKDKELIGWGEEFARIQGQFTKNSGQLEMELILSVKGKKGKVNGLEQKKLSEYVGAANVVMFAPEDLNLVKGSPQVRRRFLDMELGQISRVYLHHLGLYHKVLIQRNHLLKDLQMGKGSSDMLDILTDQLIVLAAEVTSRRFAFVKRLQKWAREIHYEISRGKEELEIRYLPSAEVLEEMDLSKIKDEFYQVYSKKRAREIQRGVTLFGPQRDDLGFIVNGRDVQTYGSQGQQRTTALAVKLAEIELIYSEIGEYPILLLDDVLSELDDYRQSHLLHTIQNRVQTFVTTTSVEGIDHKTLEHAAIFDVTEGTIKKK